MTQHSPTSRRVTLARAPRWMIGIRCRICGRFGLCTDPEICWDRAYQRGQDE